MERAFRFASRLGVRWPILQAPAGGPAGAALAAAVSEAGGLGALPLTWTAPGEAESLIAEVRRRTERPVQANFVLAFEARALQAALECGIPIVTFSWGLPVKHMDLVRAHGALCGVQVTSPAGANRALELGADFLICQGVEAGGHVQATRSLWEALPQILEAAGEVPVVAAGGIGDGRDVARALMLGASGAMLGTRFVATRESLAHEVYKRRILEAEACEAVLTVCFDQGWPQAAHRVLINSTFDRWEEAGCPPPGRRPREGEWIATGSGGRIIKRYEDVAPLAEMQGTVEAMPLYAGLSCAVIRDCPPAGEVVARLWRECEEAATGGR